MTYHYNADETEGSVDAGIATVPVNEQGEANRHKALVEQMLRGLADMKGFTKYNGSINGSETEGWVSINVMLTVTP